MHEKTCGRCRRVLPTTSFGVRRASADGLQSYCRECMAEWAREHRPRKLKDPPPVGPGQKWCRTCEEIKPVEAFARNRTAVDGLQSLCRECAAAAYRSRQQSLGKTVRPADVADGHKFCRSCGEVKPASQWSRRRGSKDGLQSRCKACASRFDRRDHLLRSYGMTVADVERLLAAQDGGCLICRSAPAAHVDHDHASGDVRGLLCFRCNAALGQLQDNPVVLRRAARYLARSLPEQRPAQPVTDITA